MAFMRHWAMIEINKTVTVHCKVNKTFNVVHFTRKH